MVTITGAVGPNQANAREDVALVQAALKLLPAANGQPFLAGNIDGGYGNQTQGAINAFQATNAADAAPAPAGVVLPGGATMAAINAALPANRTDLRVLPGQRTVYIGRPAADATAAAATIRTHVGLRQNFRMRAADLVTAFHATHGLVLSITNNGARRTFAEQAAISPPASYAGPGESNHQYGNAVDLGFNGTEWLQRNGTVVSDNHWLSALEGVSSAASAAFWDARDAVALVGPYSFFRLSFERIHLQDFDQNTTSSGRSLAAHLSNSGQWAWQTAHYNSTTRDWHYKCDLGGVNGTLVTVGTANQIFAGNATVTAAEITSAGWVRPAAAGATPPVAQGPAGTPAVQGQAGPTGPQAASPPITLTDIAAVKAALQAEFQAADTNWAAWTPVA